MICQICDRALTPDEQRIGYIYRAVPDANTGILSLEPLCDDCWWAGRPEQRTLPAPCEVEDRETVPVPPRTMSEEVYGIPEPCMDYHKDCHCRVCGAPCTVTCSGYEHDYEPRETT
jgi:hypothetical protein